MARGVKPAIRTDQRNAVDTVPPAPPWLGKDAKAEWRRVAPILIERKVLTEADLGTLESYCISVGIFRECQRAINKDGVIVEAEKGPKRHPAFGMMNSAQTTMRLAANELGFVDKRYPELC
jgi:P27 family predicted phage terminase small subunit